MKNIRFFVLVFSLLTAADFCSAQPDGKFEEWGKVTMDDMNITECSFEKDADDILLLDLAEVFYSKDKGWNNDGRFRITTAYYQRFKVLTEKGTRRADLRIVYRPGDGEKITDVKAIGYNLNNDGQLVATKLLAVDMHDTKLNKYQNALAYTVPGVKKGSVYEITYKHEQYVTYSLPSWYFTSTQPSIISSISIGFINGINYYTDLTVKNKDYSKKVEDFTSDLDDPNNFGQKLAGTTVTYTVRNIPAIHDEPFMNNGLNYMDKVSFQFQGYRYPFHGNPNTISSWAGFNRYLLDKPEFGLSISGAGIAKKNWKMLINDKMTDKEKAKALFEFVRQNIKWDGITSLVPVKDIDKTWKEKTGSSAEINILLINLLSQAGLSAYPMVVGGRDMGYFNKDYPMLEKFRSVLAMVELQDTRVVLDGSERFLPFGLIKYGLLNNTGYVIKSSVESYCYNMYNMGSNSETSYITAQIDEKNNMTGQVESVFDNYSATAYRRMKATDASARINEAVKKRLPNLNIESITDTADVKGNTFTQNVKFSHQAASDNEGNLYISMSDFYGQPKNAFVNKTRISDIDFGYKEKKYTVLELQIPEGYVVDSLISLTKLITPDSSITALFGSEIIDQKLYLQLKLEYKKSLYPVEQYEDFYQFHQLYYKLIQQPVVLKRKS